jgi:thiamine kinase-like enzyme
MPCDVVARIAPLIHQAGGPEVEVEVAQRLADTDSPAAALEPRVPPRVYVRDGFAVSMWTYYEPVHRELSSADYARALERLHAGMRTIDVTTPHFMDRVADTQRDVANRDLTPELPNAERELLANTLCSLRRSIVDRGATEQLLHGEPHPWNVLGTKDGPLFIDFENSVRGPVEYDLAWVPEEVSERYPGADQDLVGECRGLMLAIIAVWRWRRDDQHPSNPQRAEWLSAFRQGPPWPAVDVV